MPGFDGTGPDGLGPRFERRRGRPCRGVRGPKGCLRRNFHCRFFGPRILNKAGEVEVVERCERGLEAEERAFNEDKDKNG